jgi:hypothetical protein
MLESLDLYKQVSNKPVQPHQKRSIIGGKSVKYFEFGIAGQLMTALPGSQLYGLVDRTIDVDVSFPNFGDTLRQLDQDGVPIIGQLKSILFKFFD